MLLGGEDTSLKAITAKAKTIGQSLCGKPPRSNWRCQSLEGRNAVIEALRAGTQIDKIFIMKGEVDTALSPSAYNRCDSFPYPVSGFRYPHFISRRFRCKSRNKGNLYGTLQVFPQSDGYAPIAGIVPHRSGRGSLGHWKSCIQQDCHQWYLVCLNRQF